MCQSHMVNTHHMPVETHRFTEERVQVSILGILLGNDHLQQADLSEGEPS